MEEIVEKKRIKLDYVPSKKTDGSYVILMETSSEECESWYYFIRVDGNERSLEHLKNQIESIEWSILDDCSVFDIDMDHFVSASCAKEMTKVDINHASFHRKFDGVLKMIDFDFKKRDSDETKIWKVFDVLGYGQIENFIDDEDLDEEDLATDDEDEDDDDDDDEDDDDDDDDDDDEMESSEESSRFKEIKEKRSYKIPSMLK
jgi:hypothetical protein